MQKRRIGVLWSVALSLLALAGAASTHEGAASNDVGQLQVTVTDGGFWIRPNVEPGQYEVVVENLSGQDVTVELVRAQYGWTAEQLQLASEDSSDIAIAAAAGAHSRGYGIVVLEAGTWLVRSAGQDGSYAAAVTVGSAGQAAG